jgi:carbamoyltransferase
MNYRKGTAAQVGERRTHGEHMTVLGIHDGHNASACILREGRILAAVAEERLSRRKNDSGYPRRAIEEVLRAAGCSPGELTSVALGTRFMHHREFFQNWDWYRKDHNDQLRDAAAEPTRMEYFLNQRLLERTRSIVDHLGIAEEKIIVVEHHDGHAASAYYACPWVNDSEPVLVVTLDGSGDGICATVSIGGNGYLRRIAETKSAASIGKLYSRVTFLLGMKPWEDEYKVMGLAPYADRAGVERSYRVLRPLVQLDETSLVFRPGTEIWTNYCYSYLRSRLEGHRFDSIAGAAQQVVEDLVTRWVANAVAHTGIRRVACAGGVFMNVKMNMLLLDLEGIDDLFVFPSCGDESVSIGAAYKVYADYLRSSGRPITTAEIESIYLGPEFAGNAVRAAVESFAVGRYHVQTPHDMDAVVAQLLADGEIVARFRGRMEWGARALGNRSILLDPTKLSRLPDLNRAIKHRDFWMPFAPTILADRQQDYLVNPKLAKAGHMMLALRTTERGRQALCAAVHPYDLTARPQVLDAGDNLEYYKLLKRFEAATEIGGVLNTSFNLHGHPIVCSPADAFETFAGSELQFLAIENYLISKKPYSHAVS